MVFVESGGENAARNGPEQLSECQDSRPDSGADYAYLTDLYQLE
jgi:hypothetical protein